MFSEVLLTFAILTVIHTREILENGRNNEKLFLQVRPEPNPYPFITRMATERLNLTCKMFNRTDSFPVNAYNLTWRVPKEVVNSSGIVPYKFNDGTLGLRFLDLNESHSGDYTCQAESIGLRFTVKLNIKPHINKGTNGKSYCGSRMFVCSRSVLLSDNDMNNQTHNNFSLNEIHSPCISDAFVCDGRPDCPNQEDEAKDLCGTDVCAGKLQCEDKRCIPISWCEEKILHECCQKKKEYESISHDKALISDAEGPYHKTMKSNGEFEKQYRFSKDYSDHVFEGSYLRSRDSKSGVDFLHITIYTIIACAIALTIIVLVLVTMLCKTYLSNRRHFEQDANYQQARYTNANNYGYSTYQDLNRFRPAIYRSANYPYPPVTNPRILPDQRNVSSNTNEQINRENCSIRNLITRWLGLIRGNDGDSIDRDEEEMSRRMNLLNHGSSANTRYNDHLNIQSNCNRANTRQINPTGYTIVSQSDEALPSGFNSSGTENEISVTRVQNDLEEQNLESHSPHEHSNFQSNLWFRICTIFGIRTAHTNSNPNLNNLNTENLNDIFEDVNLNDLSDGNTAPAYSIIENENNSFRQASNVYVANEMFGQGLWSPPNNCNDDVTCCNLDNLGQDNVLYRPTLWSRICNSLGLGTSRISTDHNLNVGTPMHSDDVFEQADLNLNFNEILSSDEDFLTRLEDISRNVMMVSPPPYTELMLNEPPVGPPPPYSSHDNLADLNSNRNNSSNKIIEQNCNRSDNRLENLGINEGIVVGNNSIENECANEIAMPSTSACVETSILHENGNHNEDHLNAKKSSAEKVCSNQNLEESDIFNDNSNINLKQADTTSEDTNFIMNVCDDTEINVSLASISNLGIHQNSFFNLNSENILPKCGTFDNYDRLDISNSTNNILHKSSMSQMNLSDCLCNSSSQINKCDCIVDQARSFHNDKIVFDDNYPNSNSFFSCFSQNNNNVSDNLIEYDSDSSSKCSCSSDLVNSDKSRNNLSSKKKCTCILSNSINKKNVPNDDYTKFISHTKSSSNIYSESNVNENTYSCDSSNMNNNINICDNYQTNSLLDCHNNSDIQDSVEIGESNFNINDSLVENSEVFKSNSDNYESNITHNKTSFNDSQANLNVKIDKCDKMSKILCGTDNLNNFEEDHVNHIEMDSKDCDNSNVFINENKIIDDVNNCENGLNNTANDLNK